MSATETVETWWTALRTQGVPVDPRQLREALTVAKVLEAASQEARLFESIQGIFTKNERDLRLLRAIAQPYDGNVRTLGATPPRARRQRRLAVWLIATAAAAMLGAIALWYSARPVPVKTERSAAEVGPEAPSQAAVGGLSLQAVAARVTNERIVASGRPGLTPTVLAILFVPSALVLGLFLLWRSRAPDWTRLPPEAAEQRLYNNLPDSAQSNLFRSGALHSLVRSLTARSGFLQGSMDVPKTVEATAEAGGLLRVVEERPLADSPVHLAIERRSRDDHVGELYFRLADRLRSQGAFVQTSHFRGDFGNRSDERGRRVGAPEPEPWQDRALLLIAGDGETLFDPSGRGPDRAQIHHIETWPLRAFLCTRPVRLWGYREEALAEAGLAVAPASSRGLGSVAERLWRGKALTGIIGVRSAPPETGPNP